MKGQGRYGVVRTHAIDADISDSAFRLYARLASYADKENLCWPSNQTLAEESGLSLDRIRTLIRELTSAGLIERIPRYRKDGSQTSSVTRLLDAPQPEGGLSTNRGEWCVTTVHEQTTEQTSSTDHSKNPAPSGREGKEGPDMGLGFVGDLPPDEPEPTKKSPGNHGTHQWLMSRFKEEAVRHNIRGGYNVGALASAFKALRKDEGYTNEEIEIIVRVFFRKHEQDIRAKVREIDLAIMFRHRMHQVAKQAADQIRSKRKGHDARALNNQGAELLAELKRAGSK